jgi:hypothetical protein
MAIAITCAFVLAIFLFYFVRKFANLSQKYNELLNKRATSMLEDLDLATSEQLVEQLRKRPGFPYLMLKLVENDDYQGIILEVHNVKPGACVAMLHMATTLTFKELKSRGMDVPDLPSLDKQIDDFEIDDFEE